MFIAEEYSARITSCTVLCDLIFCPELNASLDLHSGTPLAEVGVVMYLCLDGHDKLVVVNPELLRKSHFEGLLIRVGQQPPLATQVLLGRGREEGEGGREGGREGDMSLLQQQFSNWPTCSLCRL